MHCLIGCLILLLSVSVSAQNLNFSETSKQLLNSEMMRSPVYVKHMARSIYLKNEQLFNKRYAELEALRKQGKLSERDFLSQTEQLKKTYQKTQLDSLPELGEAIEQDPLDSFFTLISQNNQKELLDQTNFWEETSSVPESNANKMPTYQPSTITHTPTNTRAPEKKELKKQKLGQKSYTINLDAFK